MRKCPAAIPLLVFVLLMSGCSTAHFGQGSPQGVSYWNVPRAGANMFSQFPSARRFRDARADGIRLIRLVPDRWQGMERDFLLGDADGYRGLVEADLQRLRTVLDAAHAADLRVVLTMLSLPGARWKQHNNDLDDSRLWEDERFQAQAAQFWGDLAHALAGHPAIVGYNLLNEPRTDDNKKLRAVYARLVAAIRRHDAGVPIVLDVGRDAHPTAFAGFEAFEDPAIVYAFHLYEPWQHVTWRTNRGKVPYGSDAWSRTHLEKAVSLVERWRLSQDVPVNRIFAAEIGCDRRVPGVEAYLEDALSLIEARGYHWAFFSYREDDWAGYDYEFGARALTAAEHETFARGRALDLPRPGGPAYDVIKARLRAANASSTRP